RGSRSALGRVTRGLGALGVARGEHGGRGLGRRLLDRRPGPGAIVLDLEPLLVRVGSAGHQVDRPAGQARGEADVLPAAPDRERELVLLDEDLGVLRLVVQLDRVHDRRLHGVHDVDLLRLVPADDVDLLAVELVYDVLDARAADADARAHAVDLVVDRLHRHLGAVAGVAGQ